MQLTLFEPMPKRTSKWIEGLRPETPVSKAGRRTLERRLRNVWSWLKRAGRRQGDIVEAVHQLRVAARRAMAALDGYAALLPPKKAAKYEKRLKQIRRCAGQARDCDVLLERLSAGPDASGRAPLIARIAELRREAQRPITRLYKKLKKDGFPAKARRLVDRLRRRVGDREPSFEQWARIGLSRCVESFFAAANRDLEDIERLHAFRIEGKRVRYALENFSAALGPATRPELYAEIERLQGVLGIVNDHASAAAHLAAWREAWLADAVTPLLDDLIGDERRRMAVAQREFFRWWTPQRAAELRERFDAALRRPDEEDAA